MALVFQIYEDDSGAFDYDDAPAQDFDLLDALQSKRDAGAIGEKAFLAELDRLLARFPDYIEAHLLVALHWHEQGKPKKALDAALLGASAANRRIPEGFTGRIEWGHIGNRAYLRLMQLAVMSYARLRRYMDAVALIIQMLERNPADNQGMRFQLGSEALRAGDHVLAQKVFEDLADQYPPYSYELALLHYRQRRWASAVTALRRGIAINPYIAEILTGSAQPLPLPFWHGNDMAGPVVAQDYCGAYGALWLKDYGTVAFVRWVFNHPEVLAERAAIMACRDALTVEQDPARRAGLIDRWEALHAAIDDSMSTRIVTRRRDPRTGDQPLPWLLSPL